MSRETPVCTRINPIQSNPIQLVIMISSAEWKRIVGTMSEAEARRILSVPTKDALASMTEEERIAFRPLYRDARLRVCRVDLLTDAMLASLITDKHPHCIICRETTCTCKKNAAYYIKKYGACWCHSCGYDYTEHLMVSITIWDKQDFTVLSRNQRIRADGVVYKPQSRGLYVRELCPSCSPAYVEHWEDAIQDMVEEEAQADREYREYRGRCY